MKRLIIEEDQGEVLFIESS